MLLFRQFARQRLLAVFETWVRLCPLVQRFAQTRQQIQQEQAARAWRRSQVEFVSPSLLQQAGYLHAEVERVPSQRRSVFAGLPIEDREPAIPHARVQIGSNLFLHLFFSRLATCTLKWNVSHPKGAPSSQDSQSKTESRPSRTRVFQGAKSPCQKPHGTLTFSRSRRAAARVAVPKCCHRQSQRQVTSCQRAPISSTTRSPGLSTRRMAARFSRNSMCMPDSFAGPGRPSSGDWNSM